MKLSEAITKYGDVELSSAASRDISDRIIPEIVNQKPLVKIDMSVCIEPGIDCEFSKFDNFNFKEVWKLIKVSDAPNSYFNGDGNFKHCRPRFNHIHASPTGWDKCPIPDGFTIKTWRNKYIYEGVSHGADNFWEDVTMFEITGIAEGYKL